MDARSDFGGAGERVILVDEDDNEIGTAEKIATHREGGRLHRAFSVFLFDAQGRMLIQQRAAVKYHFAGIWANACCGHPRPGEDVPTAARRRVREELGVDVEVRPVFAFRYEADDIESGLTEREYDHVLVGGLDSEPDPDPDEVAAVAWLAPDELRADVAARPEAYAPWFRDALAELNERGLLPPAAR
jgi:isopentenyl-diphosphate delta-isomerase